MCQLKHTQKKIIRAEGTLICLLIGRNIEKADVNWTGTGKAGEKGLESEVHEICSGDWG